MKLARFAWQCSIGLAAIALSASLARAEPLEVWVAPGLYGYGESNCSSSANQASATAAATWIDARLCPVIDPAVGSAFAAQFKRDMNTHFSGKVQEKPGANLPASVSSDQRLRSTLAASLHISRAGIWEVSKKNGTSIVYLPITVSLLLTNIETGQVVFTETLSTITPFNAEDKNIATSARQRFPAQMQAAISQVVQAAAAQFTPYPVSATIRGSSGKVYVADKGKAAGIRRGDLFNGDVTVLYSDSDYSIVAPIIPGEKLKEGTVLRKQNVQPAEYLSKHPAMVFMGATPDGMSSAYLKRTVESKLGTTRLFNVSTVNPSIETIRRNAGSEAQSNVSSKDREVPEYFVHLESFALNPTEFPTNIPGRSIKTFEAYSVAHIADRSGRVIYAQVASDRLTDETSDIGFAQGQRQEAVVLNSIDKLVGLINAEFKPSSLRVSVQKSGGQLVANDPTGFLSSGVTGTVLRKAGQFSGIKTPVWVPVNDSRADAANGSILLTQLDPLDGLAAAGDVFAVESGGEKPSGSRRSYGICPPPEGLPPGDLSANPLIRAVGGARFFQATRVPLYISAMPALARLSLRTFENQGDGIGITQQRSADLCIKTILRFNHTGSKTNNGLISQNFNLIAGYNVLNQKLERMAGFGSSVDISTSPLMSSTSIEDVANDTVREFYSYMNKNSARIAMKLDLLHMENSK